jgi:zinc transporter 9
MSAEGTTKVVLVAIVANGAITIAKFIGWLLSGSPSMMAESIHSLADTANQALLLVGIRHGKRGPSAAYNYGTSNARYLWNLISAMGIFFIGFGVTTYHGVHSLFLEPGEGGHIGVAALILLFALLLEGSSLFLAVKEVNKQREGRPWRSLWKDADDPTSLGVLFEDSVAVLGILLAFLGLAASSYLGWAWFDSLVSIVIGVLLGLMALFLSKLNGRLLLGKAVLPADESKLRTFLEGRSEVQKIASLKTVVLGPDRVRLSVEIEFNPSALIDRAALRHDAKELEHCPSKEEVLFACSARMVRIVGRTINELERSIHERFPDIVEIDLEVDG